MANSPLNYTLAVCVICDWSICWKSAHGEVYLHTHKGSFVVFPCHNINQFV